MQMSSVWDQYPVASHIMRASDPLVVEVALVLEFSVAVAAAAAVDTVGTDAAEDTAVAAYAVVGIAAPLRLLIFLLGLSTTLHKTPSTLLTISSFGPRTTSSHMAQLSATITSR